MEQPDTSTTPRGPHPPLLRNWLSLAGLVIAMGSLFSFLLLFVLDAFAHVANPYIGVLTYLVAPGFLIIGLMVTLVGALWHRHRLKAARQMPALEINFARPRDRRIMGLFITGSIIFLLVSAVGSYQTYQFTESVQFCGQTCHTVMQPELVTYEHGPHARVECTECHIGPGATWFVRSKLSGTYQVYATLFHKYERPIPTPVKNLRPAQQTCEQCHWPRQFVGNIDRTFHFYLDDKTNTPYSIRMLLKVGGANPTRGPVGGIHWHMSVANTIEYIATDEERQVIPWVRLTDQMGVVTVFRQPDFTNDISHYQIRTMDCMDCHNRPAHRFVPPSDAVNLALALNRIDPTLPWIKSNAVYALNRPYPTSLAGQEGVATYLANRYPNDPRILDAIPVVQQIYTNNFFPAMKSSWKVYPDNIGHKNWPGCMRCHDGNHKTPDGKRTIKANDCTACHIILAQGSGSELQHLTAGGQPFKHPGGELESGFQCTDCHGPNQ